ncbi:MAG TPA: orotidine-5'-phosphate decarboxylase [Bacteroidales bacterium]|nr:orotidine-5'-phosphate decarboxylase [Bacteroidales bacterium]
MTANQLYHQIKEKKSFLCVGLDTDLNKIPRMLLDFEYPIFEFNKQIVDATADFTIAYKPNLAFYEMHGAAGWISLEMTVNYIREKYPEIFIIADAKRGDIGNTSGMYAKAFFEKMDFDAITVSPYMGSDSVMPFLEYKNKWVIILALTSNQGAEDFQYTKGKSADKVLYEQVLQTSSIWGTTNNIMYVVGATKAEMLAKIRTIVPDHFLLVPGVGAQGGSLKDVAKYGFNSKCGLIVNSSRAIIYADCTNDFAKVAREKAQEMQEEMEELLLIHKVI